MMNEQIDIGDLVTEQHTGDSDVRESSSTTLRPRTASKQQALVVRKIKKKFSDG